MSTRLVLGITFVLTALASACASKPPIAPGTPGTPGVEDQDRDAPLDTEDAWTGRVVNYGEDFALAAGESVSFGAHAPVVRWVADGADGLVVDVIVHRVPFDAVPGVRLALGSAVAAAECALTLVRRDPVTLNVRCPQ